MLKTMYDLTISKLNEYPLFLGNFTFMLNGRDSQENWEVVDSNKINNNYSFSALRAELNKKQAANYDTTLVETQTDLNSFLTYKMKNILLRSKVQAGESIQRNA